MKEIDFSPLHDWFIEADDGSIQRADEPYFKARLRAPGTWQITTAGDYIYLVEGEKEALVIDTGNGCGNLREMCRKLTDKPIRRAANTHEHFDHTVGNCYFDEVYMTQACKDAVTSPDYRYAYLNDLDIPRDYPIHVVSDGDIIDLGGRELEVFAVPDHAAGSMMLLDRKNRLLFSGDELGTPAYKEVRTTVEAYARNVARLYEHIEEIDWIFGGGFVYDHMILYRQMQCLNQILKGSEAQVYYAPKPIMPDPDPEGRMVIPRRVPNPYDFYKHKKPDTGSRRIMTYAYCSIIYEHDRVFDHKS